MRAYADKPEDFRPALAASVLFHLALFGAGYIVWPNFSKPRLLPASTPVTLVTSTPTPDVRPAIEAPKVETAQAPEPVPDVTPEPPAPTPAPPTPTPAPAPTPTPPKPAPKPPTPAPPEPAPKLDLNALATQAAKPKPRQALDLSALAAPKNQPLDLAALAAGGKPRNAPRGPARPETDLQARQALGAAQGLSADEIGLLAAKLNRLWRPNCGVEGSGNVIIKIEMKLTPQGGLASRPSLVSQTGTGVSDAVIQASAVRALSAVAQGAPYTELPSARYNVWKDIVVNFDARKACGGF